MNTNLNISTWIKTISIGTARNPEVVASMSPAEKGRVAVEAAMYCAMGLLVFAQWSALIGAANSPVKGFLGALVFTVLFLGFDYTLGASMERQSVLGHRGWLQQASLALRILMSVIAAMVLSTAWAVKEFAHQIDTRNQMEAATANKPLREEYYARGAEENRRVLAPVEEKIRAARIERDAIRDSMGSHMAASRTQEQAASAAMQEANRQDHGVLGAAKGKGNLYHYAMAQRKAAEDAAQRAAQAMAGDQARLAALDATLNQLEAERKAAAHALGATEAGLARALESDARYITAGTDFLSRFRGLIKLMQDPRDGLATTLMLLAIACVFVTLELAYLLSKMAHAGMTYAQRDMLRERRDLDTWAYGIQMQMRQAKTQAARANAANMETAAAHDAGLRVVDLKPRQRPPRED